MLVMECSEELFSSDSLMQLFFFKQRAAYGMRISDWSSDVCSSDLPGQRIAEPAQPGPRQAAERGGEQVQQPGGESGHAGECSEWMRAPRAGGPGCAGRRGGGRSGARRDTSTQGAWRHGQTGIGQAARGEAGGQYVEHTVCAES